MEGRFRGTTRYANETNVMFNAQWRKEVKRERERKKPKGRQCERKPDPSIRPRLVSDFFRSTLFNARGSRRAMTNGSYGRGNGGRAPCDVVRSGITP